MQSSLPPSVLVVGLDFDNTIVCHDDSFAAVALAAGVREFTGKRALRDMLRLQAGGEERWTRMQADVYGPLLASARPYEGVASFIETAKRLGARVYVVSHKSIFAAAAPEGMNLHDAATSWLEERFGGVFDGVFFETTREAKVARIAALRCTHFIDDLTEVFEHPDFPEQTQRWLFDPAHVSFSEMERRLRVEVLLGHPCESLVEIGGGGNNRVFRCEMRDGTVLVKDYGRPDERRRLDHEFDGLQFLHDRGVASIARPIAADRDARLAAYSWIDGDRVLAPYSAGDIDEALAFVAELARVSSGGTTDGPLNAAEDGLLASSVFVSIARRLSRLRDINSDPVNAFLDAYDAVAKPIEERATRLPTWAVPLASESQVLSPSDFGFHNSLRSGGRMYFVDFEYFGWDDPVKLVSDFMLHPGMALTSADKKRWLEGSHAIFGGDPDYEVRLAALFPAYALKWCLIILNEFLPDGWARRAAARRHESRESAEEEQLKKAWALLDTIRNDQFVIDR